MSDNTKKRMEEAILNCAKKAELVGVWDAARDVIGMQTTAVTREFAVSSLVDEVRHRERLATLTAERAAERPRTMRESVGKVEPTSERAMQIKRDRQAATAERSRIYQARLREIEAQLTEEIDIEWTRDLLASTFGLPDGTAVMWGDATIEQHQIRSAMFRNNAQVNLEGAARHEKAIRDLTESGVPTLGELTLGEVSRAC